MTRRFGFEKGGARLEVEAVVTGSGTTFNGMSVGVNGGGGAE